LKDLEKYVQSVVENVKNDRALALTLLTDVMKGIKSGHDHRDLGQVAAKYLETLQRSNEQLTKIAGLVHKKEVSSYSVDNISKEDIYDLIKEDQADVE
jgi:hypothetical protein